MLLLKTGPCNIVRMLSARWLVPFSALSFVCGCAEDVIPRAASANSIVLSRQTVIHAAPERVFAILVDLPAYRHWNPWLTEASGRAEPGGVVVANVILGEERMRAGHVVLTVDPPSRFCWRDAGWTTAFVYGQRCRWITRLPQGGVLFRQELLLEGPFYEMAYNRYGKALRDGMAAETQAIKIRAESR